jgi:inner membrane protein
VLFLAHVGITLGAALAGEAICTRLNGANRLKAEEISALADSTQENGMTPFSHSQTTSREALFDPRFWMIGAFLPDLIDKPVGHFLFRELFGGNGRIFSHTLLFFLVILLFGLSLGFVRNRWYLLAVSFGVLMHLILDAMWQTPQTLFWPLLGWSFPQAYGSEWMGWLEGIVYSLINEPGTFVPEIMGLLLIVGFVGMLRHRKLFSKFFREGRY